MKYSDDLDLILKNELSELIEEVREKNWPFQPENLVRYYDKYRFLKNSNRNKEKDNNYSKIDK